MNFCVVTRDTVDSCRSRICAISRRTSGRIATRSLGASHWFAYRHAIAEVTAELPAGAEDSPEVQAALDESLAFDVTRSSNCASGVTGGTLEARRVWVARPAGVPASQLPDEAARVEWTGCGTATLRLGSR
jgi:hypothetical protein